MKRAKKAVGQLLIIILIIAFLQVNCFAQTNVQLHLKANKTQAMADLHDFLLNTLGLDIYARPQRAALNVFPSVQDYQISSGYFNKDDLTRIVVILNRAASQEKRLADSTTLIAREFAEHKLPADNPLYIVYADDVNRQKGDIVITMTDNSTIKSSDGYQIDIGDTINIEATSANGVMYALRTVMQYLLIEGRLPHGKIIDYPQVEERALHIDIGRKYFTVEWLKHIIKQMSISRLNTLQLHFSENQGFRLECETYPEIVSADYLTKVEMRQIIAYAKRYGVMIIPAFDSPGHLRAALRNHPEFQLENRWSEKQGNALNINDPAARQFIKNIIAEYAELFADSRYFHIGGDEFIDFNDFADYPTLAEFGQQRVAPGVTANGLDGYTAYLNEIAEFVEQKGFIARIWNDGVYRQDMTSHIALNKNIQICYWSRWDDNIVTTDSLIEKGHQLINVSEMMYYVLEKGNDYSAEYDLAVIYQTWDAATFEGEDDGEAQTYQLPNPNILGACYAIWCDQPTAQTEKEVADGIYYPLSAMAEKCWAGHRPDANLTRFQALLDKVRTLMPSY